MTVTIRPATPADAPGIARTHVDTWRTTYVGIVPDSHLAGLSYAKRESMWRPALEKPRPREHMFVAIDAHDKIVGFSDGGPNREKDSPFDGEIYAIYLRKEFQGKGVGRELFTHSVDALKRDGFKGMMLWVLEANPTCGFYARMGGQIAGEKTVEIGGATLKELSYGWTSLP